MSEQSVICKTIAAQQGAQIGYIQLNKPQALNAIDLSMVRRIDAQLVEWQSDPDVVCVVLDSQGEKAFCAGGDIVSMYNAMREEPDKTPAFLEDFFNFEYQLDYRIHTYEKPIIVWGQGIVMGGGLGLFNGASHRVVTASSRIAMPEITIGLYPDVGGSWFLNRMPGKVGLFLGLTGASINATDALYSGLANFYVGDYSCEDCLAALTRQPWPEQRETKNATREMHSITSDVLLTLHNISQGSEPEGFLAAMQTTIDDVCGKETLPEIVDAVLKLDAGENKWLAKAQKSLANGSPITAHIVFHQLQRGADMTLADCFRMELDLSCRCGSFGEFAEGVRALLIDKDMQPQWRFTSVADVPMETIQWFFTSPWDGSNHPLSMLGKV
ncbi:enoyl-CoA hydratase/isomerase family protein [Alteromonas flava]|uniref:enoyl-CoA hydratase/isomerase family protein n=1 Tax=Alteromonas flava TaxID=2048003 RepID=UPI000C282174|nr:enoyl-CoA hydratase/isomerase family protein [Alteromonas flava]